MTTLHLISLFLTLPVILYADHMGFNYMTGRTQTVSARAARISHWLVTLGLLLLIGTGIALTIPSWEYLLANPYFYVKMAFVATLFVNGIAIGATLSLATITPFAQLPAEQKRLLIISGALSGISWLATILLGFFAMWQ